jgi:hypothetical protein
LVAAQTSERNRLLKVLETGNIKLSSVASNVFGVSGRLMLGAIIEGKLDPREMAELAKGRLRKKLEPLAAALRGRIDEHHRQVLTLQMARLDELEKQLSDVEGHIAANLKPYAKEAELLTTIPGIDRHVSAIIIAELGVDMSTFPSAAKLARWAGLAPGDNESAGKRRSSRITPGNPYLRAALVQAAHAASRTKAGYLREKFYRLRSRRGPKRAAVAIARKLVIYAYQILSTKEAYKELGGDYLDNIRRPQVVASLLKRLDRLGYPAELKKAQTAPPN